MDEKFFEVKRKHHHVWAKYLKGWSADNLNVFHTTPKGGIKLDSVRGIGMELDFYKITELTDYDIDLIHQWSIRGADDLQIQHKSYLTDFLNFQRINKYYRECGRVDEAVERSIKALESKLMENLHSSHERAAAPILDELAGGKLSILYENTKLIEFMCFLGHQLARTKNFKDRVFESHTDKGPELAEILNGMRNSWWFLSYMIGMNIGRELYLFRSGYTHTLLENNSPEPFVTSDQPVINIHSQVWDLSGAPEALDLYYPISPRYAYVIAESGRFPGGKVLVSKEDIIELNSKIAARAKVLIVGTSEESIRPLVPLIGKGRLPVNRL